MSLPPSFRQWLKRCERCSQIDGGYVKKSWTMNTFLAINLLALFEKSNLFSYFTLSILWHWHFANFAVCRGCCIYPYGQCNARHTYIGLGARWYFIMSCQISRCTSYIEYFFNFACNGSIWVRKCWVVQLSKLVLHPVGVLTPQQAIVFFIKIFLFIPRNYAEFCVTEFEKISRNSVIFGVQNSANLQLQEHICVVKFC